jgi:hypothetical protein
MIGNLNFKKFLFVVALLGGATIVYFVLPYIFTKKYSIHDEVVTSKNPTEDEQSLLGASTNTANIASLAPGSDIVVTHIPTPNPLKAVYISAWVAGSNKLRDKIIEMIDTTEINAIVIDVKDSTGKISFPVSDPELAKFGSTEKRIRDIKNFVDILHKKNIYVIGRVSVFQDPYMTSHNPDWAITRKSDGKVWKDRKGLSFLDPAKEDVWKYIVSIGKEAYNQGFDEINLDYIRYPSDGNIKDINYHLAEGRKRADNIKSFFEYVSRELKSGNSLIVSGDLFGLTTVTTLPTDDLGIGQVLENALPYLDYVAPMVYPSHYATGWGGFKNPAAHPYDVIKISMDNAVAKAKAINIPASKLRPWLQDFDMGAKYTKEMVRAQIKATYDAGLTSWMLWDPANTYTVSALELN